MNNLNLGPGQPLVSRPPVYALTVKSFKCATDLLGTWRTPTYKVAFPKDHNDYPFRKEVAQLLFITNNGNQLWEVHLHKTREWYYVAKNPLYWICYPRGTH